MKQISNRSSSEVAKRYNYLKDVTFENKENNHSTYVVIYYEKK